jgi:hypothetical protein
MQKTTNKKKNKTTNKYIHEKMKKGQKTTPGRRALRGGA